MLCTTVTGWVPSGSAERSTRPSLGFSAVMRGGANRDRGTPVLLAIIGSRSDRGDYGEVHAVKLLLAPGLVLGFAFAELRDDLGAPDLQRLHQVLVRRVAELLVQQQAVGVRLLDGRGELPGLLRPAHHRPRQVGEPRAHLQHHVRYACSGADVATAGR